MTMDTSKLNLNCRRIQFGICRNIIGICTYRYSVRRVGRSIGGCRSSVAAARLLLLLWLLWLLVMESPWGSLVHFLVLVLVLVEADSRAPSALALLGLVGGVQAAVQGARGLAEAKQVRQKVERGKEGGGSWIWVGTRKGTGIWVWKRWGWSYPKDRGHRRQQQPLKMRNFY